MTITSPSSLVLGLQQALSVSRFGGMVCLNPITTGSSTLFSVDTLRDLALEIRTTSAPMSRQLQNCTRPAINDSNALREVWTEYTKIVAGTARPRGGKRPSAAPSQLDLLSATRKRLMPGNERHRWLSKAYDEMGIPEIIKNAALRLLDEMGKIRLELALASGRHFDTRLAKDADDVPAIKIDIPNSQRVLTEKQFGFLIARAILLEAAQKIVMPSRLRALHRINPSKLSQPMTVFTEVQFVLELSKALSAGRLNKYAGLVPVDRGLDAAFKPDILQRLSDAIADDEPNLGAKLYCIAVRAARADTMQKFILAWRAFTVALANPGAPLDRTPVERDALKDVIGKMGRDYAGRRRWLMDALQTLRVPAPESLLDLSKVKLEDRDAIYLEFEESNDDRFSVQADFFVSKNYIVVRIGIPTGIAPLREADIGLLVARALLMSDIKTRLPANLYERHRKVALSEIRRPVPLTLITWNKALQLGPPDVDAQNLLDLISAVRWLTVGSLITNPVHASDILRSKFDFKEYLDDPRKLESMRAQVESGFKSADLVGWKSLLSVLGMNTSLLGHISLLHLANYSFIMEIEDGRGPNLDISLQRDSRYVYVHVKLSSGTLQALRPHDLIDIALRAAGYLTTDSSKKPGFGRKIGRSRALDITQTTLGRLRDASDLPPQLLMARSTLMLAHRYENISAGMNDGSIDVAGNVDEPTKQNFAAALQAVAHFKSATKADELGASWAEVLDVKRWYLQYSGISNGPSQVDVIPLGRLGLVHIHMPPYKISPSDWLFIMSAVAANSGRAVRLNVDSREMLAGTLGDAKSLYGSIAANRIYGSLGVYDPRARMPDVIALNLPGGVPAAKNPNFALASPEERHAYIRALRWFATADMPDEWKPRASDSSDEIKHKYRAMSLALHSDRTDDPEKIRLFIDSAEHWKAVRELHKN